MKGISIIVILVIIFFQEMNNLYAEYPNSNLSAKSLSSIHKSKRRIEEIIGEYFQNLTTESEVFLKKHETELANLIKVIDKTSVLQVRRLADNLLGVKCTIDIPCGNDSILFIFEKKNNNWKRSLIWKSPDYKNASGAISGFDYAFSPATDKESWYLLGADQPARCASCWGQQRYYILAPSKSNSYPNIQYKSSELSYQCNRDAKLKVNKDYFEIDFEGRSMEVETLTRLYQYRIKFIDGFFRRVPPFADNSHDFVEEWIKTPWNEARHWCKELSCDDLKTYHDTIKRMDKKENNWKFDPVKSIILNNFKVESIRLNYYSTSKHSLSWTFFVGRDNNDNFNLISVKQNR